MFVVVFCGVLNDELRGVLGAVVVNAGGHGFFRVADDTMRARLNDALGDMSTLERYSLVDDAWGSTVAGSLSAIDLHAVREGPLGSRHRQVSVEHHRVHGRLSQAAHNT